MAPSESGVAIGQFALLATFGLVTLCVLKSERGEDTSAWREPPSATPERLAPVRPTLKVRFAQATVWLVALALAYMGVARPYWANWECHESDQFVGEDRPQALEHLERAVALDPTKELNWVKLGCAAQTAGLAATDPQDQQRLLERARQAFERSIALVPVNSYNHANLGRLLGELARRHQAEPGQAFAELDLALSLDSQNAYFYADACKVALGLGDLSRARSYATRGAELYPHFGPLHGLLGCLALLQNRPQEAARLLDEAVRSDWHGDDHDLLLALSNLSAALLRLGNYQQALVCAQLAVERDPELLDGRSNLARALELLGRREEAIDAYASILDLQPNHRSARAALVRLGVKFSDENPARSSPSR
jgi:tetratricopeptide (TPR) repeat protein